jgi:dienelactone hydrolase
MTSNQTRPVIVIIPGAWHVPAHYAYLALKLNSAGYTVDCLELSCTNDEKDLPENTWTEDISIIRNAITSHTEAGRDVAVVMHSRERVIRQSCQTHLHDLLHVPRGSKTLRLPRVAEYRSRRR